MAQYTRFINDERWEKLEPLLPKPQTSRKGGRPAVGNLSLSPLSRQKNGLYKVHFRSLHRVKR